MITIINTRILAGYTGLDHLIDGDEANDVIGTEYKSARLAQTAANKALSRNADKRVNHAPVDIEIQFASGLTRWI